MTFVPILGYEQFRFPCRINVDGPCSNWLKLFFAHPQNSQNFNNNNNKYCYYQQDFHWLWTLGRVSHRVAMSVCLCVCLSVPLWNTYFRLSWTLLVEGRIPKLAWNHTLSVVSWLVTHTVLRFWDLDLPLLPKMGDLAGEDILLWMLALVTGGRWHVTCDTRYEICDMWHFTPHMRHVTCDMWHSTSDLFLINRPGLAGAVL